MYAVVFAVLFAAACTTSNVAGPTDNEDAGVSQDFSAGASDLSMRGDVVRFVALGDTGKGNDTQKMVAAAIAQKCAKDGCDFIQLLGDNVYDSGVASTSDQQWQDKFEVPYAGVTQPFYVVLGNHDYGGNGTGNEFAKGQYEVDYTQKSSKWHLPSAYWHRTEKHVEFFGLDTNMQMYYMAGQQKTDVAAWLAASTAKWKIALGHHPVLSNGPHGNAGSYEGQAWIPIANGAGVKDFMESTVCGKVDLYICGHDHSLQWLKDQCKGTELMLSGAGAATTDLTGKNATWFQGNMPGFFYIVVDGSSLTGEVLDAGGKTLYTRTYMK